MKADMRHASRKFSRFSKLEVVYNGGRQQSEGGIAKEGVRE